MKLIIDIPKDIIESAKSSPNYYPAYRFEKIWRAIANGTPLEEELHREKEQAYYLGYKDGRKLEWTGVAESEDKE